MEMANFFELLRKESGNQGGGAAQFFSDHPAPPIARRASSRRSKLIGPRTCAGGGRSASSPASRPTCAGWGRPRPWPRSPRAADGPSLVLSLPAARRRAVRRQRAHRRPSTRYTDFRQRDDFFEMQIPSNWRAYEADNGFGVTIAPGGRRRGHGQRPAEHHLRSDREPLRSLRGQHSGRRNPTIEQASADLISQIRQGTRICRPPARGRRETIDGQPGYSTTLSGPRPSRARRSASRWSRGRWATGTSSTPC
jgi:hypothetical protein